jgi:uncharacterized damage-inducible protein DinB
MAFSDSFLPEFDAEMKTTRSLLERVPFDNAAWKPHTRSSALGSLASHIANLPSLGLLIVSQTDVDMSTRGAPQQHTNTEDLLAAFDANAAKTRDVVAQLSDADLSTPWTLRNGDHVILTLPRAAVLRTLLMNHMIHHRGQLSVYLRLNEVKLPSIYGPTADT